MATTLIGSVVVMAAFVLMLVALSFYQRVCEPSPETVRKLFHISMGLVSLTLPFFFSSVWIVIALSLVTIIALLGMRHIDGLKQQFGNVICGVKRRSFGEVYFSIAVALIFCLASDDRVVYSIAILTLTLADSAAAIIGARFGRLRFKLIKDQKSLEGSITFFTIAFLCAYVPLLLFGESEWINALLIALIVSFLLTAIEAAAWRGLDNIFVPMAALFLLRNYAKASVDDLFLHLAMILSLAAGAVSYMTISGRKVIRNA